MSHLPSPHSRTTEAHEFRSRVRPLRVLATTILAVACLVLLDTSPRAPVPTPATPRIPTQVDAGSRSILLPPWAHSSQVRGSRQVWLLPVYDTDEPPWDSIELLADVNADLQWFAAMSRDQFTFTATRVLPPLSFDSGPRGACNAIAAVLAPAISHFYSTAPADTHLVAISRARDCPYSALGDTPGRSVILTGFDPASSASASTLRHELGHNLGLPHSLGYAGAVLSTGPTPAALRRDIVDIGARADVMGGLDATPRLSAASLAALGWGEGVVEVPQTPGRHTIVLPEVAHTGPDAVVVDDPVSGSRYSFTYVNAPASIAPEVPRTGRGIYLHEVPLSTPAPLEYGRGSLSLWMPWEGYDSGSSMGIGAGPGTAWLSPTSTIRMKVRELRADSAVIVVTIDPAGELTDTTGPAWPLRPRVDHQPGRTVASLVLPAAWDQSGIARYRITARGARVHAITEPTDLVFPGKATIILTHPRATVRVIAVDGAGNRSRWRTRVRVGS